MRGRWTLGISGIILLVAVFAGQPGATASPVTQSGWAVLIENDWYAGRYASLPVAHINSTRMLTLLMRRGWLAEHTLLIRDDLDSNLLRRAVGWLASRVRPGDTALLYVAGEYEFFARDLHWAEALPALWEQIPTSRRVLIAETCFAERLTAAVRGIPGLALPAVGRDELDWWGLGETDRLIPGGIFTYYLTRALEGQPPDAPLAFGAAFGDAVVQEQSYFRAVICPTPGALDAFHLRGQFPELLATFPNPHLSGDDDGAPARVLAEAAPP